MKGLGKIVLILGAVLSIVCFLWVVFTPNAFNAKNFEGDWMENPVVSLLIFSALAFVTIAVIAFIIYKVVDLLKHPEHRKEAIWVFGAILIAFVIGFIFSSGDTITTAKEVVEGTKSRLIGTGLITSGILFFACLVFLLWDTVKGIIKG